MKNPKTTLLGVLMIVSAIINAAITYLKTATLPDFTTFGPVILGGWGLIKAADADPEIPPATGIGTASPTADDPIYQSPPRRITPLIVLCLALPMMTGCAWINTHRTQIDETLAIVGQRALALAETVLISAATDAVDKDFKANFLDSVASGLRANEGNIVTSEDVAKIVQIWSPNDGAQWQALAGGAASLTATTLQTHGDTQAAVVVEQIATGLNQAASNARQ